MSYHGQSPTVKRVRYTPQATDPVSPTEGDLFYADGNSRTEGLYVYANGAWELLASSGANIFDSVVHTAQSSDPGSPAVGEVFYSDGTARAAGLWVYSSAGWVQITGSRTQEFYYKAVVQVRVATTASLTLSSQVENGDTIDGVVLATGDLVLVKNQGTASQNGVYVVAASGTPSRHSSADTYSELNNYSAQVLEGTANKNLIYYQTATLTSLSDSQTWSTTPASFSMTVPEGVYQVEALVCGAGGGGGAGGGSGLASSSAGAAGGSGGGGSQPRTIVMPVTPGETLTISPGKHGLMGVGAAAADGNDGGTGGSSIITGGLMTITVAGANGGLGGDEAVGSAATTGASALADAWSARLEQVGSGAGGNGTNTGGGGETAGTAGNYSMFAGGGAAGTNNTTSGGGGGGGGGAGLQAGGAGGTGTQVSGVNPPTIARGAAGGIGAGGGGGGGIGAISAGSKIGGSGGPGGSGYVRLSW